MSSSLKKFEMNHLVIAMESAVLTKDNFFDNIATRLTAFMSDVKCYLTETFSNESSFPENVNFTAGNNALIAKLMNINYTSVKAVEVYCPPGLSVSYLELMDKLEEASLVTSALKKDIIVPILKWLAVHINKPEMLSTFSGGDTITDLKEHDLQAIKDKLKQCFSASPTKVKLLYGSAFKRNSDWNESIKRATIIFNNINKYPIKELNEDVNEICKRFDILIKKLEDKDNAVNMTANKVQILSKLCYTIAQECEFYAFYCFQMQSTLVALMDTEEKLGQAFNVN